MGVGVLEVSALGAALVVLNEIEKAAPIRLLQAELNDYYGYVIKIVGEPASLRAAIDAGRECAEQMHAKCVTTIINAPDNNAWKAIESPPEYQTQGFTAVIEAIDAACKAASVEVIGKEKLGGGYITVLIKGDVAAVNAAVETGKTRVDGLGTLIAAHVIARPSPAILSLLPVIPSPRG